MDTLRPIWYTVPANLCINMCMYMYMQVQTTMYISPLNPGYTQNK